MTTQIKYKNDIYLLPSDCSLSVGNSCDTRTGRMSDGSETSYSITTFRKPQVSTFSLSFTLTTAEYSDILERVYKWESLVGKNIEFIYSNIPFGKLIITGINISFGLDGIKGIVSAAITINMKENLVITQKTKVATRLI